MCQERSRQDVHKQTGLACRVLTYYYQLFIYLLTFPPSLALVNKGNVLFAYEDYEKAREFFKEALSNDSSCVEALYNLGEHFLLLLFYVFVLLNMSVCSSQ